MVTYNRRDIESTISRVRKQEAAEDITCWAMAAAMFVGACVIAFAL